MKKQRPVNIEYITILTTIKWPAAAIASILHRISGVIMIFAIGILLWTLSLSLSSAEGFAQVKSLLDGVFFTFIIIGILSALIFHVLGGIRHLLMDLGHFEEKESGRISAKLVFALWLLLTVVVGVNLW
ncbi:MAG: succinate dehydrogenase, cytochrome b556 subunit [Colwellia sp.]|nr:succinate dehydrogenase, cytochrome b556 subunit [Colwellia sp.]